MEEREEKGATEPVSFFQEKRVIVVAAIVLIADQVTKQIVVNTIDTEGKVILIEGFLKFVNWQNTGAAWSQFQGKSLQLAAISLVALGALIHYRHHFGIHTKTGKLAMGMLIGGILGNLIDRVAYQHVVDFIRFYLYQRGGGEIGYPAFNIADTGICVGVGLLFVQAWKEQPEKIKDE
jgi:signal peptidase II